ncbi:hypothetical protein K040078D81_39540 [Blautia hominis]|uniref:BppU N-terminal domain-containing protein n=2 Tax=Blautia hominis TaxID=2025493 RepID=A0ABQ0BEG4_9FIRM
MKAVKKIEISVLHKRTMPLVVYTMQGDTGREIECAVVDWDIPAGVVARAWVVKPSKKVVYSEARIVENSVVFSLTNQMLAEPGVAICIIEFDSGEDVVSSFPFNLCIDGSARGDGIPSENESTVLEGMFEALGQDAIKALDAAKAEAVAANKSAQDTEKIKNDFTLTAQQAVADVNNAGQTQTQRVNTAGDTQVSRIQAEGTTQVQNVQATAAEISADREQIHTNRDNTARLQRTTAGAITRSAEGSFITLGDAADEMGFRRIEIEGETRQVTTTGAQMIDFEQCLKNWKSQYTQVGGRVYKITAIGTGYQAPVAFSESDIKVTLSGIIRDLSGSGYRVDLIDSSGNIVGRINKDIKSITGLASKIRLNFAEAGAGEYSDIMLNAGSAAITWEPYTGNKPSPSPEYPQEMENVGRQNTDGKYAVKVTATKTQLLDTRINFWAQGAINTGGAESENAARIRTTGKTHVDPKQIYTLNISDGYYIAYHQYDKNEEYISDSSWIASYPHIMVLNKNTNYVKFTVYKEGNEAITPAVIYNGLKIMLNVGSAPLPWEPYRGHTATITSDRPLTKWDKLTCRDGVWGWAYGGTKYICSLNEVISQHGASIGKKYPCMTFSMKGKARDAGEVCACNYLKSVGSEALNGNAIGIWGHTNPTYKNYVYIGIPYSVLGTTIDSTADENTAAMTAWINAKKEAGAPVTIEYKLAEEEWVPLSAEEQAAMNALCTYAGTTHIWTDDPLQPVISLDYTVDTEGYIRETAPAYRDVERFALTGEASGTVATCTDSADWPLLGIGMLGKCEQLTTTGKNLIGGKALADKIKEVAPSSTINADGTVTFSAPSIDGKLLYDNFEPGKQYTVVLYGKNASAESISCNLKVEYEDGTSNALTFATKNALSYCAYTTVQNKTVVSLRGLWSTQSTVLQYDKCGIFEGAIDLASFEPYTGAAPSPSPAYKQEIQETGTYNPETGMYEAMWRQCGENLFDMDAWYEYYYAFKKDIFWETIDGRKCLKWRGRSGNDGKFNVFPSHISSGHKIRLSFYSKKQQTSGHDDTGLFLTNKGGTNILGSYAPDTTTWTYTEIETVLKEDCCGLKIAYSNEAYCYFSDISLAVDSDNTEYQPYQSDTLRLTADQPWRGTGDVHDEVCDRDGVLGTWRRYAEYTFNGSEDEAWGKSPDFECRYFIVPGKRMLPDKMLSTHFRHKYWGTNDGEFGAGTSANGTIYFCNHAIDNIADWKAWLADNPVTIVVLLETPVWEPFPEDVQKQYRKLKSYAGTTHAWVDDPLQPEVSFRYIKDSKLVLGKLEDRLTALEAGQAQTAAAFGYLPANIQAEMIENETNQLMDSI